MGIIKILSHKEAQKIAAGEVVERPANVVKELVDNARDAGAHHIEIDVTEGGKERIRVSDDGSGMPPEDAQTCLSHHATSKIQTVTELPHVATFGFRGEALSSIASVSRLIITTRQATEDAGTRVIAEEGEITDVQTVPCSPGTTIEVHDLFAHVPARHKFLKKRDTEWRSIHAIVSAAVLSDTQCGFTLTHDERKVLHVTKNDDVQARLHAVTHNALHDNLIPCSTHHQTHNIHVEGYVTRPTYTRYDRSLFFCFLNGRPVKMPRLVTAALKGYRDILPPQRYPAGCLYITVDPETVDINVHPRKEEVMLLHQRRVERNITHAVEAALEATLQRDVSGQPHSHHIDQSAPSRGAYHSEEASPAFNSPSSRPHAYEAPTVQHTHIPPEAAPPQPREYRSLTVASAPQPPPATQRPQQMPSSATTAGNTSYGKDGKDGKAPSFGTQDTTITKERSYTLIGQALHTYILLEHNNELIIIDQHAAHERILYDQLQDTAEPNAATRLMFPHCIELSHEEVEHVAALIDDLQKAGVDVALLSPTQITINALPSHLTAAEAEDLIKEVIGTYAAGETQEADKLHAQIHHTVYATMACKAAVKAGDVLQTTQMYHIIDSLYATPHGMTCPHGRPTWWRLTNNDIARMFQRS